MRLKYVVIERSGKEGVIVFSSFLPHQEVAGNYQIKSAGFCELTDQGRWMVGGRSDSLACHSRPEDGEILNRHLLPVNKWQPHFAAASLTPQTK